MKFCSAGAVRIWWALVGLGLAAAGALNAEGEQSPHKTPGLIFSHERHAGKAGIACLGCHAGAPDSRLGTDDLLPDKKTCAACHAVTAKKTCGTCHGAADDPRPLEPAKDYSPRFSHAVHLKLVEDCTACHAGLERPDSTSMGHLPRMEPCMACHDGKTADRRCIVCHEDPKGKLPASHRAASWKSNHAGIVLKDDGASCRVCHLDAHCQVCHPGDSLIP